MDIDDLKSEVRAAEMGAEDLSGRAAAAEPAEVKEIEIDINLAEHELEELEGKADRLKADLEDAGDEAGLATIEEQLETLAQAREGLRAASNSLDDVPQVSDLGGAPEVAAASDALETGVER